jgi:hypothetical protein
MSFRSRKETQTISNAKAGNDNLYKSISGHSGQERVNNNSL